jgi:hypothetical protein
MRERSVIALSLLLSIVLSLIEQSGGSFHLGIAERPEQDLSRMRTSAVCQAPARISYRSGSRRVSDRSADLH